MIKQNIHSVPRWRALLNTLRFVRDPIGLIGQNTEKLGSTFYTYLGGIYRGIVTIEPALIQHVLQNRQPPCIHNVYQNSLRHL